MTRAWNMFSSMFRRRRDTTCPPTQTDGFRRVRLSAPDFCTVKQIASHQLLNIPALASLSALRASLMSTISRQGGLKCTKVFKIMVS